MDPKKVQAVQEWPRPNSRKELQRPGSQNGKPDALSRVFSKEETRKTPETILPLRRVVGALQWGIEGKVRAALRGDPGPGNGPPGRLFVPEGTRPAVLEWGHSSKLTCHPGVARTMSFLRRRFWWPAMDLQVMASRWNVALATPGLQKRAELPPFGPLLSSDLIIAIGITDFNLLGP
ncbi:hypothetical protein DPEC_G00194410 [Dallia pectoralis]|uniref:Uncharacterized protein n=1 Tax=Dallia pectoralis TaxID=75939 RepID=A0ACC2G7D9_DALPE|nr:hypothetical protein DPEC_G00194410 [Dallia pectoralis]